MVANMQSLSSQDRCPSKEILTRSTDGHANSPKHCYGAFKAQTQFFFSPEEQHFWDKGHGTSLLQAIGARPRFRKGSSLNTEANVSDWNLQQYKHISAEIPTKYCPETGLC